MSSFAPLRGGGFAASLSLSCSVVPSASRSAFFGEMLVRVAEQSPATRRGKSQELVGDFVGFPTLRDYGP
jgi:hypothetical protein